MNTKKLVPLNLIILLVVIIGLVTIGLLNQNTIHELAEKDIRNITRLTQSNIYADIHLALSEPVNTSVVMSNNTLLNNIMNNDTPETTERISAYLKRIQDSSGYESTFLVPHSSLNYYYPEGIVAKLDLTSEGTYWYSERINAKEDYKLNVNTELLDDNALYIYVNATLRDEDGNFAGLTGVGVKLTHILEMLATHEEKSNVEAYLVDHNGLIQIHTDLSLVKQTIFYEKESINPSEYTLAISDKKPVEIQVDGNFITIQYIDAFDWFLIVNKSTSDFEDVLNQLSFQILLITVVAIVTMLLISHYAINKYKNQILHLSHIDYLTGIPNRSIFDKELRSAIKNITKQSFCLILFDIDNLKQVNDTFGHDTGDRALVTVAAIAKGHIQKPHVVARIGGDEFAILYFDSLDPSIDAITEMHKDIQANRALKNLKATISIGLSEAHESDSPSSIYKRVDEALYRSKTSGKDSIVID